jgi:hypothetical protein
VQRRKGTEAVVEEEIEGVAVAGVGGSGGVVGKLLEALDGDAAEVVGEGSVLRLHDRADLVTPADVGGSKISCRCCFLAVTALLGVGSCQAVDLAGGADRIGDVVGGSAAAGDAGIGSATAGDASVVGAPASSAGSPCGGGTAPRRLDSRSSGPPPTRGGEERAGTGERAKP